MPTYDVTLRYVARVEVDAEHDDAESIQWLALDEMDSNHENIQWDWHAVQEASNGA